MEQKNIYKNLKKWIGAAALAGSLLVPSVAKGGEDRIKITNSAVDTTIVKSGYMLNEHAPPFAEFEDIYDTPWSTGPPLFETYDQWLKIESSPYEVSLQDDGRPLESESQFINKLSVVDKTGINISHTNKLSFWAYSLDSTRHYTAKIHLEGTYTPNGTNFDKLINIRETLSNDGKSLNLPGITNVPDGAVYGTVDVNPQFNRLVSSKTGNGTNSFEGNTICNYEDNTNVVLNANPDYYVKQYTLTRTDNTGLVSVITNDLPQSVTSTNIPIDNIKGSNSIYAVYAPKTTANGIPHTWLTQNGITNKNDSVETQNEDGDINNNLEEYILDTNPTNNQSYYPNVGIAKGNSMEIAINPTSTGRNYKVYSTSNLATNPISWNFETNSLGTGSNLIFHLSDEFDKRYYQTSIELP